MLESKITSDDGWFTNQDHRFVIQVFQSDGVTPQDITGWSLSWIVKKSLTLPDASAILTKTTSGGISLTTPASGICTVSVADTDTLSLAPGVYVHELKRTDDGQETVLVQASAVLRKSAHAS